MKRKINNRLIGTAALAILATLLLTAAVCYNTFKKQVMEDLKGYAGIIRYAVARIEKGKIKSDFGCREWNCYF